jgi:hypothetical protein
MNQSISSSYQLSVGYTLGQRSTPLPIHLPGLLISASCPSYMQASRWKQLWRPHLAPCVLQPDQLSFLLKTRTREALRWTTMSEDPEQIITQQVCVCGGGGEDEAGGPVCLHLISNYHEGRSKAPHSLVDALAG